MKNNFLLYKSGSGEVRVEVMLQNETVWLTQKALAQLFGKDRSVITKHLKNIFESGELQEEKVCAFFAQTTQHGAITDKTQTREVKYYNLDAIISVGYRVNSVQATHFRIWATQILKEYIIKGFAMDDERLKNPNQPFGKDYFEEQLERIRDIGSSTPFNSNTKRITRHTAEKRNEKIIEMSDEIVVGYVTDGGQLSKLLKHVNFSCL